MSYGFIVHYSFESVFFQRLMSDHAHLLDFRGIPLRRNLNVYHGLTALKSTQQVGCLHTFYAAIWALRSCGGGVGIILKSIRDNGILYTWALFNVKNMYDINIL